MNARVLYESETRLRPLFVVFLIGFSGFWFGFFGYGLLVKNEPFSVASAIATVIFGALDCFFLVGIIRGGSQSIRICDDAVRWSGPWVGSRTILHADVDSFEVIEPGGDASLSTRIQLKSGEAVFLPSIGDGAAIHRILLTKWKYLGRRSAGRPEEAHFAARPARRPLPAIGPILLVRLIRCLNLWLLARTSGLSLGFGEILAMIERGTDARAVVRALAEAHAAGLSVGLEEIERASLEGIDLQSLIVALIDAKRTSHDPAGERPADDSAVRPDRPV